MRELTDALKANILEKHLKVSVADRSLIKISHALVWTYCQLTESCLAVLHGEKKR